MKIISDKPLRVATLGGTAVLFEAGVAREIADEIGLLAIQMGAKEVSAKTPKEAPVEESLPQETEEGNDDLVQVLKNLIEEANPSSFKNDGTPKANIVNKILGRTVRSEERESAWEIALNA